uniref:Uncharacterized protein n=1 Tax=Nocardia terpenica TaxID=455432 RepID=A0A809RDE4_9NOCA|nr:hypothetical protein [Nocardia terpenica]
MPTHETEKVDDSGAPWLERARCGVRPRLDRRGSCGRPRRGFPIRSVIDH